jgi:hypothetical protein
MVAFLSFLPGLSRLGRSAYRMNRGARSGRIPVVGTIIIGVLTLVLVVAGVLVGVGSIHLVRTVIGDRYVFVAGRKNQQEGGEYD